MGSAAPLAGFTIERDSVVLDFWEGDKRHGAHFRGYARLIPDGGGDPVPIDYVVRAPANHFGRRVVLRAHREFVPEMVRAGARLQPE